MVIADIGLTTEMVAFMGSNTATQFKPGQVANPGGRPAGSGRLQLMCLQRLDEAFLIFMEIVRTGGGDKAALQLSAIKELFDRGFGKAAQSVALDVALQKPINDMSADELREFRERYRLAVATAPTVIEATAEREPEGVQLDMLRNAK